MMKHKTDEKIAKLRRGLFGLAFQSIFILINIMVGERSPYLHMHTLAGGGSVGASPANIFRV